MGKMPYSYSRVNTSRDSFRADGYIRAREISESARPPMHVVKPRVLSSDLDIRLRHHMRHPSINDRKPTTSLGVVPSLHALQKGVKDIREARTAQEVRDIMAQVNQRYKHGDKYL
jgi:hypothetical protein